MSNQIEQIRAEVERRNLANYCGTAEQYEEELFAILDTIEAEEKEHPVPDDVQEATTAWKPTPEQMEALMLTIEGDAPAPTSYLSRRLEDLYEGLANTYGVECDLHNEDKPEVGSSLRDETGRKKKISPSTLFRILLAFAKYNIIAAICAFCSVLL